jgi:hypothetical protein
MFHDGATPHNICQSIRPTTENVMSSFLTNVANIAKQYEADASWKLFVATDYMKHNDRDFWIQ